MARSRAPAPDCNVEVDCRGKGGAYCGKCCRRAVVPLLRSDIEKLAERLGDTSRYVEWVSGVPVLKRSESGACIFLDASGRCVVYDVRPLACRLYPLTYTPGLWVHVDPACPKSETVSVESIVKCASLVEKFPRIIAQDWLGEVHVLDASVHREAFTQGPVAKFNMRAT